MKAIRFGVIGLPGRILSHAQGWGFGWVAVFGLSNHDRGTKDHSLTCAGSLIRVGGSQREKGRDSIEQFEGEVRQ